VIRAKDFDQAVASTDDSFYQELSSLLCECREVVEQFNASIIAEDRFGSRDPTLSNTRSALDMVASLVQNLIARRGLNRVWTSASEESESAPPLRPGTSTLQVRAPQGMTGGFTPSGTEPTAGPSMLTTAAKVIPVSVRRMVAYTMGHAGWRSRSPIRSGRWAHHGGSDG
jgi:hypothetical protein